MSDLLYIKYLVQARPLGPEATSQFELRFSQSHCLCLQMAHYRVEYVSVCYRLEHV